MAADLWTRLREARVVRILVAYLVASWIVLQVTNALRDALELPSWVSPVAIILLLVGLVVVLATAWIQSHPLTPHRESTGEVPASHEVGLADIGRSLRKGELPHLTWGRVLVGGAFAFALLFGVAGLYVVIQDRGRAFAPGGAEASDAAPGIAVLPFQVTGTGLEVWREGMVDLLSTNLDGTAGLRTIDSRTVLARWREAVPGDGQADLDTALEVGRKAGARYVLIGSAVAIGGGVRLTADVYDATSGDELGQGLVEGPPDSVFALVDRLSIDVLRAILSRREGPLPAVDLARVTTSSLPALKAYLEGEVQYRNSDFQTAIPAYERAVEADTTFALAYSRLSSSYGWAESVVSELAVESADRAARFADRLPQREAVLVRADRALFQGMLDGLEPLREAVRRYPDDPEAWYLLGDTIWHLADDALVDRAEADAAFARAIELDPRFTPAYLHRIDWAYYHDDSTTVRQLMTAYERITGRSLYPRYRLAYPLAFGDASARAEALREIDTLSIGLASMATQNLNHPRSLEIQAAVLEAGRRSRNPRTAAQSSLLSFYNRIQRGQMTAALEALDAAAFAADQRGMAVYLAHARGLPVPEARLETELDLAAADTFPMAVFYAGAYAAERGRWDEHSAAIDRLRAAASRRLAGGDSSGARFTAGTARALEGLGAWKRGRRDEALDVLQAAQREATGHATREVVNATIRWWVGDLLVELGRPREAIRYYTLYYLDPLVAYRRAEIHEQLGDYATARQEYERFLLAWRNPDPELAPVAERARQAVLRLRGLRRG